MRDRAGNPHDLAGLHPIFVDAIRRNRDEDVPKISQMYGNRRHVLDAMDSLTTAASSVKEWTKRLERLTQAQRAMLYHIYAFREKAARGELPQVAIAAGLGISDSVVVMRRLHSLRRLGLIHFDRGPGNRKVIKILVPRQIMASVTGEP